MFNCSDFGGKYFTNVFADRTMYVPDGWMASFGFRSFFQLAECRHSYDERFQAGLPDFSWNNIPKRV
jgi:hypothetical protein